MAKSPHQVIVDPEEAIANAKSKRYEARAAYLEIINQRGNDILALSEKSGPRSTPYKEAQRQFANAQAQFDRIHAVVRRPINKFHVATWIVLTFGAVLAVLEAPVNKFLFDVALRSTNVASYAIAIAFAAFLLALAHIAGTSLRQIWSEYRRKIVWSSLIVFLVLLFVLFALVSILTVARASFSTNVGAVTFNDMFSDVTSTIDSVGIWHTLRLAFSDVSALVLATINIGGIFMTLMVGFFSHDPDKDFDHSERFLKNCTRKLEKLDAEYTKGKKGIIQNYAPDLTGYSRNYRTANMDVIKYKELLQRPLDSDDDLVIDELDTLAEESEHEDAGGTPVFKSKEPEVEPRVVTFDR